MARCDRSKACDANVKVTESKKDCVCADDKCEEGEYCIAVPTETAYTNVCHALPRCKYDYNDEECACFEKDKNAYDATYGSAMPEESCDADQFCWTDGTCNSYSTNQASGGSASASSFGSKIVEAAQIEHAFWNAGGYKETNLAVQGHLNAYYAAAKAPQHQLPGAWSAAFISYVMKTAGVTNFPVSTLHSNYFVDIRDDSAPTSCVAIKNTPKNVNNLQPGQVLCKCRGNGCSTTFDSVKKGDEGHCDIVVSIIDDSVTVIGGNIKDTVDSYNVGKSYILGESPYYGIISC